MIFSSRNLSKVSLRFPFPLSLPFRYRQGHDHAFVKLSQQLLPTWCELTSNLRSLGARWYSFRRIFHDWPDAACKKILANTHEAMRKDYSTLLLHEFILPEVGYTATEAFADLCMSSMAGMERTEKQFRGLLEPAGFRIIKIWPAQIGSMCIIEAEAV